jgi:hypothetical protein
MLQKHSNPCAAIFHGCLAISIHSTHIYWAFTECSTPLEASTAIQTWQKQRPHSSQWGRIVWHPSHMRKDYSLGNGRRWFSQVLHWSVETDPPKNISSQTLSHTHTIRVDFGPILGHRMTEQPVNASRGLETMWSLRGEWFCDPSTHCKRRFILGQGKLFQSLLYL